MPISEEAIAREVALTGIRPDQARRNIETRRIINARMARPDRGTVLASNWIK